MNYEEKYKQAIEAAKRELHYCGSLDSDAARQIFRLFPELKKSRDERIRKRLIETMSHFQREAAKESCDADFEFAKSAIAWLEKQGEQENLCDKCRKEQPSHSCQDITALGRCALEKQGEQKPVECIKFDNEFENQISYLIASVLNGEHEYNETFVKYVAQSLLGYAKNELKPAEWSEEDKEIIESIIEDLERSKKKYIGLTGEYSYNVQINWLKSLKPQLHWKPEGQQLDCLRHMIDVSTVDKIDKKIVRDLYEQLKSL